MREIVERVGGIWRRVPLFALALFALAVVLFFASGIGTRGTSGEELNELRGVSWGYDEYADYFSALAEEKGSSYAYRVLAGAPIAYGVDTHMLAHVIGYVFHKEKGAQALADCTPDFQNGCAHAVVTQELIQNGADSLTRLMEVCAGKTERTEEYTACFHGIGHGLIAYTAYDFKRASEKCREVYEFLLPSQNIENAEEMWGECVGGATMELGLGIHDKAARDLVKGIYMPDSDILMPCDAPYLAKEVRPWCYLYNRQRFFTAAGRTADDRVPNPETYAQALRYCAQIPPGEQDSINACYGGFGVDFTYFANGNDGRDLGLMPDAALDNIHTWCTLAPDYNGVSACTLTAVGIVAGGKGDDMSGAVRFCRRAPDSEISRRCFTTLIPIAREALERGEFAAFCSGIPAEHRVSCMQKDKKI